MLDIRRIRSNPEAVIQALSKRHGDFHIDQVLSLDEKRRNIIIQADEMKAEQNRVS